MQNILRNPLVSPFTLGLSSAASFGAAVAIAFGSGVFGSFFVFGHEFFIKNVYVASMAIVASLVSVSLVILLSRRPGISRSTIVLTGVIVSYLFQAGISAIKYFSNDDALREITLWLMGGMWNSTWGVVFLVLFHKFGYAFIPFSGLHKAPLVLFKDIKVKCAMWSV